MGCGNLNAGVVAVALQFHWPMVVAWGGLARLEKERRVELRVEVAAAAMGLRGGSCSALEGREAEQRGRGVSWGARELRGAGN